MIAAAFCSEFGGEGGGGSGGDGRSEGFGGGGGGGPQAGVVGGEEAGGDVGLQGGEEGVVEAVGVEYHDVAVVEAELAVADDFGEFFEGADAAGQGDDGLRQAGHSGFARVHGVGDDGFGCVGVVPAAVDHELRDDAHGVAAGGAAATSGSAHQPHAAAAVDERQARAGDFAAKFCGLLNVKRVGTGGRPAEYGNTLWHKRLCFIAEVEFDGRTGELPVLANLVFEIAAVGLFDPLGQVAEEDEGGHACILKHGYVLDFDVLTLVGWRRICGDVFLQGAVEGGGGHGLAAVLVDLACGFHHLVDALLGEGGGEDDGEVGEGSESRANRFLEVLDGGLRFVGGDVPLVHHNH